MFLLYYQVKLKHNTMQIMKIFLSLTNFVLIYSGFLKVVNGNTLILSNYKLLTLTISCWQISVYPQLNMFINFILNLTLYNKA